jgi:hypothetical protein
MANVTNELGSERILQNIPRDAEHTFFRSQHMLVGVSLPEAAATRPLIGEPRELLGALDEGAAV